MHLTSVEQRLRHHFSQKNATWRHDNAHGLVATWTDDAVNVALVLDKPATGAHVVETLLLARERNAFPTLAYVGEPSLVALEAAARFGVRLVDATALPDVVAATPAPEPAFDVEAESEAIAHVPPATFALPEPAWAVERASERIALEPPAALAVEAESEAIVFAPGPQAADAAEDADAVRRTRRAPAFGVVAASEALAFAPEPPWGVEAASEAIALPPELPFDIEAASEALVFLDALVAPGVELPLLVPAAEVPLLVAHEETVTVAVVDDAPVSQPEVAVAPEPIALPEPIAVPLASEVVVAMAEALVAAAPTLEAAPMPDLSTIVAAEPATSADAITIAESALAPPALAEPPAVEAPMAEAEVVPALPWDIHAPHDADVVAARVEAAEVEAMPWNHHDTELVESPRRGAPSPLDHPTALPGALPSAATWGLPWPRPIAPADGLAVHDPSLWGSKERIHALREDLERTGGGSFGAVKPQGSAWLKRLQDFGSP